MQQQSGIRTVAYIGLGANLGQSRNTLQLTLQELQALPEILELRCSRFYRSAPVDSSGPDYVNAVARLVTTFTSQALLRALQQIELAHGRERPYRNAPRTLDLDILLFGNESSNDPVLTLPHPRMHQRAFVLKPLQELAPSLRLPHGDLASLLSQCEDQPLQLLDSN